MTAGPLTRLFGVQKGQAVAIVGCGGKTSLLRALALEWRDHSRVLVSTTTKIAREEAAFCDGVYASPSLWDTIPRAPGAYAVGMAAGPKLTAPPPASLEAMWKRFDLALLECDGSRRMALKGWREDEPVVPSFAHLTLCVATVQPIGQIVHPGLVFQPELFYEISGAAHGQSLEPRHLSAALSHPRGPFHRAHGRRILYFNQVESPSHMGLVRQVLDDLPREWLDSLDAVVAGSIRDHTFTSLLGEQE